MDQRTQRIADALDAIFLADGVPPFKQEGMNADPDDYCLDCIYLPQLHELSTTPIQNRDLLKRMSESLNQLAGCSPSIFPGIGRVRALIYTLQKEGVDPAKVAAEVRRADPEGESAHFTIDDRRGSFGGCTSRRQLLDAVEVVLREQR